MKNYGSQKGIAEMREMYKNAHDEVKRLRLILKTRDNKIEDLRTRHKVAINKMKWKNFKLSQICYGKDMEIAKINRKKQGHYQKWRRIGYREAMRKTKRQNFRVKGLSRFMFHMAEVMNIYKLNLEEYSFIMWAGMYDFFDRKDFEISNKGTSVQFYLMIRKMINKGYAIVVASKTGETRKVFALTGIGYDMYNRIAKFTNKFLIDAGTSDIRNNLQDTSGSQEG